MTSIAAWAGVDSRGPASLYFASDSRITWEAGVNWDSGRKLFASSSSGEIFGYCGDVLFPSIVLGQVDSLLTQGILACDPEKSMDHGMVRSLLEGLFRTYPKPHQNAFTVLHGVREGSGMSSRFRVWRTDWSLQDGWRDEEIDVPTTSVLALTVGSGARVVTRWDEDWRRLLGRTSRGVFGSFCDALKSQTDPKTGG